MGGKCSAPLVKSLGGRPLRCLAEAYRAGDTDRRSSAIGFRPYRSTVAVIPATIREATLVVTMLSLLSGTFGVLGSGGEAATGGERRYSVRVEQENRADP